MINTDLTLQIAYCFSICILLSLSTLVGFLALIAIFICQEKRNKIIAGIICFICLPLVLAYKLTTTASRIDLKTSNLYALIHNNTLPWDWH